MKKFISLIIFILILLLISTNAFAQEIKNDKYDCMAKKVILYCDGKDMYLNMDGDIWTQVVGERKENGIKKFIILKEEQFLKDKANEKITTTYFAIYCGKLPEWDISIFEDSNLAFRVDHFLWKGRSIDCAYTEVEERNFLKFEPSISFLSMSPFSINLFPITIVGSPLLIYFINRKYKFISIKFNFKNKKQ